MNLLVGTVNAAISSYRFVLQYATSTSGPWSNVSSSADSWCNDTSDITCSTSWTSRQKVIFDNADSAETLTNFPVLVKLNSSRIDYSKVQNNGEDLRFVDPSDPTTVLPHEIESWNESGDSFVWVNVPSISAGSTTGYIWLYYNNAVASNGENVTGVWHSSYEAVYHMAEIPDTDGGTAEILDSTGTHNATAMGTMGSGDQVTGQVNGSVDLDGTDDYLRREADTNLILLGDMSLSAVFKRDTVTDDVIVDYGASGETLDTNHAFELWFDASSQLVYEHERDGGINTTEVSVNSVATPLGSWGNFAFTRDSTAAEIKFYENGSQLGGTQTYTNNPNGATTAFLNIGRDSANSKYADGTVDELRISNVKRTEDYLEAEHKTIFDTFNTYGTEEIYNASWKFKGNATPADGATVTSTLLSTSTVAASYTESNPTVVNPNAINTGQYGEWDFSLNPVSATVSTTYYFRMVKIGDVALDAYTRYPSITISSGGVETPSLSQLMRHGRWFNSSGVKQPFTF